MSLTTIVASLLLFTAAPSDLLSDPKAQEYWEQAQFLFQEEDYGGAAKMLEKAYLVEPVPDLLYPWAQAERINGNCDVAIDLYQQFLDTGAEGKIAEAAQTNIDRCNEELAESGAVVPTDDPLPEDDDLEEIIDEQPDPEPEPEPVKRTDDEPKSKPRAWYKDPAGGVLTGLGVVGVGAGVALIFVATGAAKGAPDADDHDDYFGERDRATGLRNGGAAALSIGSALLLGGIIRYAVVAKKNKRADTTAWFDGRGGGVSVRGRF